MRDKISWRHRSKHCHIYSDAKISKHGWPTWYVLEPYFFIQFAWFSYVIKRIWHSLAAVIIFYYTRPEKILLNSQKPSVTLSQTSPGFCVSAVQVFWKQNTVGKGEIACNKQFLLFPSVFSTCLDNFPPFSWNSKSLSWNSFGLEASKICHFGKAL